VRLTKALLHARDEVFFATTFTFDIAGFDDYLFPKLGAPPLNATVLIDDGRLDAYYRSAAERDETAAASRAGQHYALRPVHWNGNAFHAKTYVSGTKKGGRLVVGSGNLGLSGISEGNEVACLFSSDDPAARTSIAAWTAWMDRLVGLLGDEVVGDRWARALSTCPWLQATDGGTTSFHHNLDQPLLKQLLAAGPRKADQLLIGAPFFDEDADVVATLARELAPREVLCHLGDNASVDGEALMGALSPVRRVHYLGPDPDAYVHAKLIAIVRGDDALVMSGSANLSRKAMLYAGSHGNCETAVLGRATAAQAHEVFNGRLKWVPLSHSDLAAFKYAKPVEAKGASGLRLTAAAFRDEPTLEIHGTGEWQDGAAIRLLQPVPGAIDLTGTPSGSAWWSVRIDLPQSVDPSLSTAVVAVVDGEWASNCIPVDHPRTLNAMLGARKAVPSPADDLPGGTDDPMLEALVSWLRQGTNFSGLEALDSLSRGRAARVGGLEEGEDDFVPDELELQVQSRRASRWLTRRAVGLDDLLTAIGLLGAEIPAAHRLRLVNLHDHDGRAVAMDHEPTPNLRVRLKNALQKMCSAATDVRLFERDPTTSAYNIVTLIEALWLLDQVPPCTRYLARDARRTLLKTLLEGLSGVDNKSGLVELLVGEDRAQLQTLLGDETPRLIADLVLSAVSREHSGFDPDVLFEWKPLLTRLVDEGLCQPRDEAQADSINSALDFMDDNHWPAVIHTRHGVDCSIKRLKGNQTLLTFKLALPGDLFSDPRITAAVWEWFRYFRPAHGEMIQLRCADEIPGADSWRIAITVGAVAYAKWPGQSAVASSAEITLEALRLLLSDGNGMRAAFPDQPRAEAIPA
jgi:hypothetical protein